MQTSIKKTDRLEACPQWRPTKNKSGEVERRSGGVSFRGKEKQIVSTISVPSLTQEKRKKKNMCTHFFLFHLFEFWEKRRILVQSFLAGPLLLVNSRYGTYKRINTTYCSHTGTQDSPCKISQRIE